MIRLGRDIVGDFHEASSREWLETNGIGGFASGTVSGAHTRRYHGLLTAATSPPVGRVLLLSKFEETAIVNGKRFELSANRYPGKIHPRGFTFQNAFRLDPFPTWELFIDSVKIEKTVFMPQGRNAVVCQWKVTGEFESVSIELRPLLAFRDHHHLRRHSDHFSFRQVDTQTVSIEMVGSSHAVAISHNGNGLVTTGDWYRNFEYSLEEERGFEFRENLFQPFMIRGDLAQGVTVVASTERVSCAEAEALREGELHRRRSLTATADPADGFEKQLMLAADQFIVKRGEGRTVIAGYPWFSDWGRDTMIALPGLTLATARPAIAKEILREFSHHISMGMIPNRFPDKGEEPDYNTVDATLWFIEAVRAYMSATDDVDFVRDELFERLADIVSWHLKGTRHDIHVDTDGLLCAGETGTQLTWMDAKCGDEVFTPRVGKPVEIQALWYNALKVMEELADRFGDTERSALYKSTSDMAQQSFNGIFWNSESECLFDVVDGTFKDRSIRPNQIFAVSLHHAILDDIGLAKKVVESVETNLLTPLGLRSLSGADPRYRGIYKGTPHERDSSYHQGPVWAWLIGPYIDAFMKVFPERHSECALLLEGFKQHMTEACLGQISEIFDGDFPHEPRGCPAQAWSVSEVLRSLRRLS